MMRQYRQLQRDEQFVIGADPAESRDFCSAVAISKKMADSPLVFNARMDSTQFGHELTKMGKFIQKATGYWPTIGVERNMGQATIAKLIELNYPQLFKMKSFDLQFQEEIERIGWVTSTTSRVKLLDDLAHALKHREHKIYDADTISQLYSFIRNPRTNKPEAERSAHDDLVMAEGISWQLFQLVPSQQTDFDYATWEANQKLDEEWVNDI